MRWRTNSLKTLSAKTVLNYHTGLSALWTWAIKEELVGRQIVRDVQPSQPDKHEIVPLSEEQVKAMLGACERTRGYSRPGKRPCNHERPTALRPQR